MLGSSSLRGPGVAARRLRADQRGDADEALEHAAGGALAVGVLQEEAPQVAVGGEAAADAHPTALRLLAQLEEPAVFQGEDLREAAQLQVAHAHLL